VALIVADTDALIDFLHGKGLASRHVARALEAGLLCTTAVSRFELLGGARDDAQQKVIRRLIDAIPTLPLDRAAADRAAGVRRELGGRGAGIGMGDSLIAGIVLEQEGTLLTRNTKRFNRVAGLVLAKIVED